VISHASGHGRSGAERLVNAAEVVVHEVERDRQDGAVNLCLKLAK
jgi:hypothetical protein